MTSRFTLIICTYMRPNPLLDLLKSVNKQTLYPDEILIIDGSKDDLTNKLLDSYSFKNLKYFKVFDENRGLTRQRNYGLNLVDDSSEFIYFLDDDVMLQSDYFEQIMSTYKQYPDAIAVGGYISNEVKWFPSNKKNEKSKFYFDNWMRKEPSRYRLRNILGLQPNSDPGFLPNFGYARSTGFLPPSKKTYYVEFFMGGVSSYKKSLFNEIQFSHYFEGYCLYEDLDFCLRASKLGKLYVNTAAQLEHYHEASGRPNMFAYGKMVVRNSWYIWKVKYKKTTLKQIIKFHATTFLLMTIHFSNSFHGEEKIKSFTETLGRFIGWLSLLLNRPKVK